MFFFFFPVFFTLLTDYFDDYESNANSVAWDEEGQVREDSMVYARSPSLFSDDTEPIYFVFTKNPQDTIAMADRKGVEKQSDEGEEEIFFSEEDDEAEAAHAQRKEEIGEESMSAWQYMLRGLEHLLEILPRPTLAPVPSQQQVDGDVKRYNEEEQLFTQSPHYHHHRLSTDTDHDNEKTYHSDRESDMDRSVTASFFIVPSPGSPAANRSPMSPASSPTSSSPTLPSSSSPIASRAHAKSSPPFSATLHPRPARSSPLSLVSSSYPPAPVSSAQLVPTKSRSQQIETNIQR
jgi:hypothetical protein